MQKFKETGDSQNIYQSELVKACFQHDMAYGDFKDLTRKTASDKIFRDKALNITKNPKHDGYQHRLTSMVYKFLKKKHLVELLHLHGQRPWLRKINLQLKMTICHTKN